MDKGRRSERQPIAASAARGDGNNRKTNEYGAIKASSSPSSPSSSSSRRPPPLFTCFKVVLLFTLIIINTIEFCHRMLLFNLSATPTPHCTKSCQNAVSFPTCMDCPADLDDIASCQLCRFCRIRHHSGYYNLRDHACITPNKYGLLGGLGFTITFAFSGLTVDYLAHHFGHSTVHISSILLWSLAIIGLGLSDSFREMLVSRAVLGLAQGFNAPCCFTLISSFFPEHIHPLVNGLFSMGSFMGMGSSSLSINVALKIGWRNTCYVAGLIGMGMGLIYAFILQQGKVKWASSRKKRQAEAEEKRRKRIEQQQPPQQPSEEEMEEESRSFIVEDEWYDAEQHHHQPTSPPARCELFQNLREVISFYPMQILYLAAACRVVGTRTLTAYLPIFYQRAFTKHMKKFGYLNGIGWSICGSISSGLGGWVAGQLSKDSPSALAFFPAAGAVLSLLPLGLVVSYYANFHISYAALLLHYLLSECWIGPVVAILQRVMRIEVQGTAVAVLLTINSLVSSTGLTILGFLDDGTAEIAWPLFAVVVGAYVLAAIFLCILGVHLSRKGLYRQVQQQP